VESSSLSNRASSARRVGGQARPRRPLLVEAPSGLVGPRLGVDDGAPRLLELRRVSIA
jgi:hypothetical protein